MNHRDEPDDTYEPELEDDMFNHRERERSPNDRWQRPKVVSDFLRRAIENTVGSVEKSGSLSREALQYLLQQGDRGKKEVVRIVAHEVNDFLKNVDLSSEVLKVLTNLEVDVHASIKFKTKDGAIQPVITTHRAEVTEQKSEPPFEPEPQLNETPKDD